MAVGESADGDQHGALADGPLWRVLPVPAGAGGRRRPCRRAALLSTVDAGAMTAVHGVRSRWAGIVRAEGLRRPDSATFLVGAAPDRRHRTLLLATYFALSMSTLRRWNEERPARYADWYAANAEALPALVLLDPPPGWADVDPSLGREYLCWLDGAYGPSAPCL